MHYLRVLSAIPGFFLSSLFLMLLWDAIAPRLGLADIGYVTSMLITVTVWIVVVPVTAVNRRRFR